MENNSLSGDKSRESVKQVTSNLKDQVRDKLGEGTLSAIVNSIINATADTGDAILDGADYGADAAMALTSCAMGDSYCTQALNDLAGKNQAAADTLKALMKSETWTAVAGQVKEAAQGNQLALEATGGMLAGLFLPGKKLPDVGAVIVSDSIAFSAKQLDKKFKHAVDFDVVTTKKNPETLKQYEAAIKNHMDDTTTFEKGTYGFVKDSKVFFNPTTNNAVVIDKSGKFITGFKVIPGTPQYDNFMKNGVLRWITYFWTLLDLLLLKDCQQQYFQKHI
nr:colicin D domain-containing protein [Yersinia bercovieri]